MRVLLTGGMGYIGSHTAVCLLKAGHEVIILDNYCNSKVEVAERIYQITGKKVTACEGDVRNKEILNHVLEYHNIDSVIHFAGLKAVGESVAKPLEYYDNNVIGTINLCETIEANPKVRNLVFSSSATVYGEPAEMPIKESFPTGGTTNPYGTSKYVIERILMDWQKAYPQINLAILRYFNPVGAHESGKIGEDPNGIPNNLMPYITQVAVGKRPHLNVFGNDYPTHDGTGVRDYIHVMDLAEGHLKALEKLNESLGLGIWNLGTGTGYSVLDVVKSFERASGKPIPYKIAPRRAGDIAECYADPSKAEKELGWKAKRNLEKMCEDSWRWQSQNPEGYQNK